MKLEYKQYLLSPEWRQKRINILQRDKCCRACKSETGLQVHHLHYWNIYKEKEEDLLVLCYKCHDELHKMQKSFFNNGSTIKEITEWCIGNYEQRLRGIALLKNKIPSKAKLERKKKRREQRRLQNIKKAEKEKKRLQTIENSKPWKHLFWHKIWQ